MTSIRKHLLGGAMLIRFVRILISLCLLTNSSNPILAIDRSQHQNYITVTVQIHPGHPLNRFVPPYTLCAALDGLHHGQIYQLLFLANILVMLSTSLKLLMYRLLTE